jgi:hypothetical protein
MIMHSEQNKNKILYSLLFEKKHQLTKRYRLIINPGVSSSFVIVNQFVTIMDIVL